MFSEKNVSLFAWEMLIPCCLVWDGVKLELELELELAGLGCSDFKEEKGIINIFMGHYITSIEIIFLLKNIVFGKSSPTLHKKNDNILHYVKYTNPGESGVLSF